MCEPSWRTDLALIMQDEIVQYVAAMFMWFRRWQLARGSWPRLPLGEVELGREMEEEIDLRLHRALRCNVMAMGEMQALKVLIALQCLAEAGPRKPASGYVSQCIKSLVCPLMAMGIGFMAHAMMASVPSGRSSHSTSLETDVSTAGISSLLSSVRSSRELANRAGSEAAMDVSTTVSMETASETPSEGTIVDQKERDDE